MFRPPSYAGGRCLPGLMMTAALAIAGMASAEDPDHQQAMMLAGSCFSCHGTEGRYGEDSIPAIAGRPAEILEAQLLAFRNDEVPGTTIMNRLAKGYTDEQIGLLAWYFAGIDVSQSE